MFFLNLGGVEISLGGVGFDHFWLPLFRGDEIILTGMFQIR